MTATMGSASETFWRSAKPAAAGLSLSEKNWGQSTPSQTPEPCSVIADMPAVAGEDTWLIRQSLRGDRQAGERLFTRYMRAEYQRALAILGSPEEAEDALQDALLSAFRNLPRFEGRSTFRTWLTRIVINAALMRLRSRRVHQAVRLIEETEEHEQGLIQVLHDPCPTPEEDFIEQELREILAYAFYELPERSRHVLLHYLGGCSVGKTAEIVGISTGAIKGTLLRARLSVAMHLKKLKDHQRMLLSMSAAGDRARGRSEGAMDRWLGTVAGQLRLCGNRVPEQKSHVRLS